MAPARKTNLKLAALERDADALGVSSAQLVQLAALDVQLQKRPGGAITLDDVNGMGLYVAEARFVIDRMRTRGIMEGLKKKMRPDTGSRAAKKVSVTPSARSHLRSVGTASVQKWPRVGTIAEMCAVAADSMHRAHPDQLKAICELFNIKPVELMNPIRRPGIVTARAALQWLLTKTTSRSLQDIAGRFVSLEKDDKGREYAVAGIDHTTIMYSRNKFDMLMARGGIKENGEQHPIITRDIAAKLGALADAMSLPNLSAPKKPPVVPRSESDISAQPA